MPRLWRNGRKKRRSELALRPELAESLGRSAVEAIELGYYLTDNGKVDWSDAVRAACESKVSIAPEAELPTCGTVALCRGDCASYQRDYAGCVTTVGG